MQKQRHTWCVLSRSAYIPGPASPAATGKAFPAYAVQHPKHHPVASAAQGAEELSHSNKHKEAPEEDAMRLTIKYCGKPGVAVGGEKLILQVRQ